jgi:hypothetical protein
MVNVFPRGHWRLLALLHIALRPLIWPWIVVGIVIELITFTVMKALQKEDMLPPERLLDLPLKYTKDSLLAPGRWTQPMLSFIWWTSYFLLQSTDQFLQEFIQTWHEELSERGTVVWVNIFVSDQHLCVPISFESGKEIVGTDRQTFEALHMWYSLMRVKRGVSEIILPRRLVRVDKVGVRKPRLVARFNTYDQCSSVAVFKAPSALGTAFKLTDLVEMGQVKLQIWWNGGQLVYVNDIRLKLWSQTPVPRAWNLSGPGTPLLYHSLV